MSSKTVEKSRTKSFCKVEGLRGIIMDIGIVGEDKEVREIGVD